jgi:hypothetical protein
MRGNPWYYLALPPGTRSLQGVETRGIPTRDGGCSSMVEHWTVAPVVAGSSPVIHPKPSSESTDASNGAEVDHDRGGVYRRLKYSTRRDQEGS